MVPGEFGHLPEYREVTGTPPGSIWALLGLSGREEEAAKEAPQAQSELGGEPAPLPIRIGLEGARPLLGSLLLSPTMAQ